MSGLSALCAAIHRELGDRWHLANALAHLGTALREIDDPRAIRTCELVDRNLTAGS